MLPRPLVDAGQLVAFLDRLDGLGAAIDAYASPELILDDLLLLWPRHPGRDRGRRGRRGCHAMTGGRPARERLHATVRGSVQGVGYRWFVQRVASRLELDGWVANRADRSVEVVAEGPREAIDELLDRPVGWAAVEQRGGSGHPARARARRSGRVPHPVRQSSRRLGTRCPAGAAVTIGCRAVFPALVSWLTHGVPDRAHRP